MFNKTATFLFQDLLFSFVPDEYDKWVPILIQYICKIIAFHIAWFLAKIITGLYTAIAGGLLFSRAALRYVHKQKLDHLNILGETFDPEETYWDEALGWTAALLGFSLQFYCGFEVPGLILNVLLSPVIIAEKTFEYYLMDTDNGPA
jgi:hypothetical protein